MQINKSTFFLKIKKKEGEKENIKGIPCTHYFGITLESTSIKQTGSNINRR